MRQPIIFKNLLLIISFSNYRKNTDKLFTSIIEETQKTLQYDHKPTRQIHYA